MLTDLTLISRSLIIRLMAGKNLTGSAFDLYGRKKAFSFLNFKDRNHFLNLICNPVSIVRYFEFQFVLDSLTNKPYKTYLDVSSPRILFLYLLQKKIVSNADLVNPDKADLEVTKKYLHKFNLTNKTNAHELDITKRTQFEDKSYDLITSVSVIEHIPDNGDIEAVKNLWKLIKPGGKLIITVPCAKKHSEEFRDNNTYNLKTNKTKNNKFFFQRVYDSKTINKNIIETIGKKPTKIKIFGEKNNGTYYAYEQRWISSGLKETIKDPLHIKQDYQIYPNIDSLPGLGICGLTFKKEI